MQYHINRKITALELANALGLDVFGDKNQIISEVKPLFDSKLGILTFSTQKIAELKQGVVIGFKGSLAESLLVSSTPRLDFCRALQYLLEQKFLVTDSYVSNIHETVKVAKTAVIEESVTIGKNTCIENNVTIHKGTVIGENCIIRANSVIGAQGFGFEKNNDGQWVRFPHLGRVVIGDNVEIGALNSVCVGTLGDTKINDGVKTDNLVHIAHNCDVGKNSILTACTELSGGVTLGEGVWMGPNTSTMQKITIGNSAIVGLGSVVTKNVETGHTVAGVPAKVIRRG